jgi:hypothetical protein
VVNRTRKLNSKLAGHRRHLSSMPNCVSRKSTAYGLTPFAPFPIVEVRPLCKLNPRRLVFHYLCQRTVFTRELTPSWQ